MDVAHVALDVIEAQVEEDDLGVYRGLLRYLMRAEASCIQDRSEGDYPVQGPIGLQATGEGRNKQRFVGSNSRIGKGKRRLVTPAGHLKEEARMHVHVDGEYEGAGEWCIAELPKISIPLLKPQIPPPHLFYLCNALIKVG